MRILGVGVVTAIALTFVQSGFGADDVAGGSTVDGLRLGAAFGSDPSKPTLRVLLQNVGSDFEEVLFGHEQGGTFYDSMKFIATLPTGEEREGMQLQCVSPISGSGSGRLCASKRWRNP